MNIVAFVDLSGNFHGDSLRRKSSSIQKAFPTPVFLAEVLGVHTAERAWPRGAAGEEEVARQLDKRGPSWPVHSSEIAESDR